MKTMLSTVLVALGLTFGATAFAAEPAEVQPAAAHVEAKKGGVERKDRKRERHAKKGERKGEHRHHKGHRHARRHRHERRER
jgi:Ni/Co efflux regulator RcnB